MLAVPGAWLLLKAFASACTAVTGVEAVSNGVTAFRQPATTVAKRSLTIIIGILIALLAGLAWLIHAYGIIATDPARPGYQSVLSILIGAVTGRGVFFYFAMASITAVLCLSANTSFAESPRLCRVMALDHFLPAVFAIRGRRLVYTHGVFALIVSAAVLLVAFGGVTDRLIPLFAVGAFLAFRLSQAGMVVHWWQDKRFGLAAVNAVGAAATGATILIVLTAKFLDGAWIVALLLPVLYFAMVMIRRHYHRVAQDIMTVSPLNVGSTADPIVIVPIDQWSRVSRRALAFAMRLSSDVRAVHIEDNNSQSTLVRRWDQLVVLPAQAAKLQPPSLTVIHSAFALWCLLFCSLCRK